LLVNIPNDRRIPVKKCGGSKDNSEWAGLSYFAHMSVGDFITQQLETTNENNSCHKAKLYLDGASQSVGKPLLYIHDWSLPLHCKEILPFLSIPKWFSFDFIQAENVNAEYKNSWPSLFVGPAKSRSEMHIDSYGTHFYMALIHGKKDWTLFSRESVPFLYPIHCPSGLDPIFQVDIANPDMNEFPLYSKAEGWTCTLEAGDLIFVPSGCPHHVVNVLDTVAVSANYVDPTCYDLVMKELIALSGFDKKAKNLWQELSDEKLQHLSCRLLKLANVLVYSHSTDVVTQDGISMSSTSDENNVLHREHLQWNSFKEQFQNLGPSFNMERDSKRQKIEEDATNQNSMLEEFSADWSN
jgi:hypothetical protein